MQKIVLLIVATLVFACRTAPEKRKFDETDIKAKYDRYMAALTDLQDQHGFIEVDRCDSLLFSGLAAAAGASVSLGAAEFAPGRWYRRPTSYPECYSHGLSRSTVSRDGLLGVYWFAWSRMDYSLLVNIYNYGYSRNWVMGDDSVGGLHTVLNAPMIGLLNDLISRLGGPNRIFTWYPRVDASCRGYVCHLQVLRFILSGKVSGHVSEIALHEVAKIYARNNWNPLYAYAYHRYKDGNMQPVIDRLMNSPFHPHEGPPTSSVVCDEWPVQREVDELRPCDHNRQHSGGDWLFVASLLLGR